jgi:uncharacterized membrane protein
MNRPNVGLIDTGLTALAPVAWGTTYVVATEFLPPGHPLLVAALRSLPVGLCLTLAFRKLPQGIWWWRMLILGGLNIGIFQALLFVAAYRLPGGVAATAGAIQPVLVIVFAWLILQEKPDKRAIPIAIAGFLGIAMLVLGPSARARAEGHSRRLGRSRHDGSWDCAGETLAIAGAPTHLHRLATHGGGCLTAPGGPHRRRLLYRIHADTPARVDLPGHSGNGVGLSAVVSRYWQALSRCSFLPGATEPGGRNADWLCLAQAKLNGHSADRDIDYFCQCFTGSTHQCYPSASSSRLSSEKITSLYVVSLRI